MKCLLFCFPYIYIYRVKLGYKNFKVKRNDCNRYNAAFVRDHNIQFDVNHPYGQILYTSLSPRHQLYPYPAYTNLPGFKSLCIRLFLFSARLLCRYLRPQQICEDHKNTWANLQSQANFASPPFLSSWVERITVNGMGGISGVWVGVK